MRPRLRHSDLRLRLAQNIRNFLKAYESLVASHEREGIPVPAKEQLELLESGQPVIVTADKLATIAPELMISVYPDAPNYVLEPDGSVHPASNDDPHPIVAESRDS